MTHLQPKRVKQEDTDDKKSVCKALLPFKATNDTKHSLSFAVSAAEKQKMAILMCTETQLQTETKLSLYQCRKLKKKVAKELHPLHLKPALEIKPCQRLTTGCDKLNNFLCGGLPVGRLIELSGQSGCGKTQLCLQLSLTAQWPADFAGLEAGVLYISTLEYFPSKRLQQLINCFPSPMKSKPNYGDNIFIERVGDVDELWQCVSKRAPHLMSQRTIRLLIVDSVAGVFRTHLEKGLSNRALELRNLAKQLMKLSVEHNAAVICVNQVAEVPFNEEEETYGIREVPALGLSWANLMHTRLKMSKDQSGSRHLEALSSNEIPHGMKCPYQIVSHGLFGS